MEYTSQKGLFHVNADNLFFTAALSIVGISTMLAVAYRNPMTESMIPWTQRLRYVNVFAGMSLCIAALAVTIASGGTSTDKVFGGLQEWRELTFLWIVIFIGIATMVISPLVAAFSFWLIHTRPQPLAYRTTYLGRREYVTTRSVRAKGPKEIVNDTIIFGL